MSYDIKWLGNEHTNSSDRGGIKPIAIVNHISAGSMSSMDSWFRTPNNKVSSAHFGVSKDGRIHQYVKIERMAWANGLKRENFKNAKADIVKALGVNPNLYTVSIEHEGTDGKLTEEQFQASLWLHFYIRDYVKEVYGIEMKLDRDHVLGHFQIDPIRKPNCPGKFFPFERLYTELLKGTAKGLSVEDANAIIRILQVQFAAAKTNQEREEIHRLANELRKITGQLK